MTYCVIHDAGLRVVKKSQNLRGILDYSRAHTVEGVDLYESARLLGVTWTNGASTVVRFADAKVMRRWAEARKCFQGATFNYHG